MHRRGFTLLELLVATGVFMFGFVAVYSMFLAGVRNRQLADTITRTSLAATSIIAEIRMHAGREGLVGNQGPHAPSMYTGDGLAYNGSELDGADAFYCRFDGQPGIWYRVRDVTDITGDAGNTKAVALRFNLVVLYHKIPSGVLDDERLLPQSVLKTRLKSLLRNTPDSEIDKVLVERQVAQNYDVIVHRQASWMP